MSSSERSALRISRLIPRLLAAGIAILSFGIAAGADAVRLTTDGTLKLSPAFINNGEEIAFATHARPNLVAIYALSVRDGSRRRLLPSVVNHQFDPAASRDGRFLAFARSATSPQMVLVIHDLNEKKDVVFQPRESRATARNPSFAPDGSRVVFSLSDYGGHQIASVNSQGNDLKRLTNAPGMNAWPVFAPDGRKIAFGSSRTGNFEIYVMNADGGDVVPLTKEPGLDVRPAWSGDGSKIAFTSNRDGNYEIYVMNADGSAARDDHPVWHPDGRRILFLSDRDGGSDFYLTTVAEQAPASRP
jgi:Tol biopolymer transport system component